jgi:hypothetical protein
MPQLVAAVHNVDGAIQDVACQLMDRLPPDTLAPHAPALARRLGLRREDIVPILAELDLCADPEVRAALCGVLQSENCKARVDALRALDRQQSGPLAVYVPALIKVLLSVDNLTCQKDCDPGLSETPEEEMRELAFNLLKRVDPSELVAHLEQVLEVLRDIDGPVTVREMAVKAVSLLPHSVVVPHVQLVLQTMKESDGEELGEDTYHSRVATRMRESAGTLLRRLELPLPVLEKLVPELLEDLMDWSVCDGAALLLAKLPPALLHHHFGPVLRALIYRCNVEYLEGDPWRPILKQMDPPVLAEHTDEFEKALRHWDDLARSSALQALASMFPLASIAAHAATLRDMLADPSSGVQKMAVELLARLSAPALADGLATLPAQPEVRAGLLQALA